MNNFSKAKTKPKKRPSEEELHNYADIQTTESSKVCERESKLIIISFVNCSHSQLESKSFTESKSFNQLMYYLNIRAQHLLSSSASVISPKKRKPKPKKNIKVTKRTKPAKRCQERQPTIIRIYLLTPPPKENASASPLG